MDGKNNNVHGKVHCVSKKSDYYKFFLIKPRSNANAKEVAKELIAFNEVAEVYVTEGLAGFMVKAKFFSDNSPSNIEHYIKDKLGSRFGTLISPMQYAKVSK
ncbi:MAG: hypothetical protein ACP5TL_01910 [Candidatus Micrarchaeia archaeon]